MISEDAIKKCLALSKAVTLRDIYAIDFPHFTLQKNPAYPAGEHTAPSSEKYREFFLSATQTINKEQFEILSPVTQAHISSVINVENELASKECQEHPWLMKTLVSDSRLLNKTSALHTDIASANTLTDRQYISVTADGTDIIQHSDIRTILSTPIFEESLDTPLSKIEFNQWKNFKNPLYSFILYNKISNEFNAQTQNLLKEAQNNFTESAKRSNPDYCALISVLTQHKRPKIVTKDRNTVTSIVTFDVL